MRFNETKNGYPVYLFRRDSVEASQGKVTNISSPRVNISNPSNPMPGTFAQTNPLVVDVTIEENGVNKTYTIPENLEVTYAGDLVIATTREGILREVEAVKSRADEFLSNMEKYKSTSVSCEKILTEWNPAFKEKKETEARFGAIEDDMREVKDMIKELIGKLG